MHKPSDNKVFDNFQESINELCFDLTVEDISEPQAKQLKFCDWAAAMITNSPMYQGRPVNPDGTIANYFAQFMIHFIENCRFNYLQDFQGETSWFMAYKTKLVELLGEDQQVPHWW